MSIRLKLTLSFLFVSLAIALLGGIDYYHEISMADMHAVEEAEVIAKTIAVLVTDRMTDSSGSHETMQRHVEALKSVQNRDIAVVDMSETIIADAIPSEIGTKFVHDPKDEVGQTIRDGKVRFFAEVSEVYPEGIKLLAVPLQIKDGGRLGALVYEYTPLYAEILKEANRQALRYLILYAVVLVFFVLLGYVISDRIARPLGELVRATRKISSGDLDVRVDHKSSDELGALAHGFNAMAEDLQKHINSLVLTNRELEGEIVERRRKEEALERSEKKFHTIFESANDAIFLLDFKGNFIDINRVAYERLGYTKDEMLGIHISRLDPPEFAARVPERFERIIRDGYAVFESAHLRKDGTAMPVEVSTRVVDFGQGEMIFSVVRDITERKRAETELRIALHQKETLLRELYHRTKNNLQIVNSLLDLQARDVRDPEVARVFKETKNRIYSMALIHEKLYQSQDLSKVNLGDYFSDLSRAVLMSYGVRGVIAIHLNVDPALVSLETVFPCGLVVNELLSNSIKHAFPDKAGGEEIGISCRVHEGGRIELVYEDNGIGIPEGLDVTHPKTLGLRLVANLVEKQLMGSISVQREHGTRFIMRFQELKYRERI